MSDLLSFDAFLRCNESPANDSTNNISMLAFCRNNKSLKFYYTFSEPLPRIAFIMASLLVCMACVFGNFIVLLVTARNLRMQTQTNILLANLAVADMCVGIFCVIPNMLNYLFFEWYLGRILCKMYQFMESMCFTASMLLLEVIAVERYIAINHPLKAKRLFTKRKMILTQVMVWFVSSLYNFPFLIIYDTIESREYNVTSTVCFLSAINFDIKPFYVFTFIIWYLLPLLIMSIMYITIANTLWRSSLPLQMPQLNGSRSNVSRTSSSQSGGGGGGGGGSAQNSRSPVSMRTTLESNQICNLIEPSTSGGSCSSGVNPNSTELDRPKETTTVKYISKLKPDFCRVLFKRRQKSPGRTVETVHFRSSFKFDKNKDARESPSPKSVDSKSPTYLFPSYSANDPLFALNRGGSLKRETSLTLSESPTTSSKTNLMENAKHGANNANHQTTLPKHACLPHSKMSLQRTSRRRVVKLLIVLLFTFAMLVLPNHVRLLLLYFHPLDVQWGATSGPICHTLMYLNSALNPFLYSFFSEAFRRSLKELFYCCRSKQPRT